MREVPTTEKKPSVSSHYAEDMSWGEFICCFLGIVLAAISWGFIKGVSIFSKIGGDTSLGILCFRVGGVVTIFGLLYYFSGLIVKRMHLGRSVNAFLETFSVTFALFDVVLQLYNNQIPT